jgi:NAD(P)-dependent dehydrogenase (short-subunit alcohol dehydrogenase family)
MGGGRRPFGQTAAVSHAGKVVAVTGAGSGLGAEVARAFARGGATVVCNDVDAASAAAIAAEIGARALPCPGDVSVEADVQRLVDVCVDECGGLDVMHANAAISIYESLETVDTPTLERILDVNLKGPLLCARAAIPALRERGGGSIIFVSSVQAYLGLPGCVTYVAAKAGLVAAARTLAVEVGPLGIRVNAIAPGTMDTPMLERDLAPMNTREQDAFLQRVVAANALGRLGTPADVAAAALYLASDEASYVTGTCLVVDGGFLAVKTL